MKEARFKLWRAVTWRHDDMGKLFIVKSILSLLSRQDVAELTF